MSVTLLTEVERSAARARQEIDSVARQPHRDFSQGRTPQAMRVQIEKLTTEVKLARARAEQAEQKATLATKSAPDAWSFVLVDGAGGC